MHVITNTRNSMKHLDEPRTFLKTTIKKFKLGKMKLGCGGTCL